MVWLPPEQDHQSPPLIIPHPVLAVVRLSPSTADGYYVMGRIAAARPGVGIEPMALHAWPEGTCCDSSRHPVFSAFARGKLKNTVIYWDKTCGYGLGCVVQPPGRGD
jgi:hypothetical protein